jgi:hypothetical protein
LEKVEYLGFPERVPLPEQANEEWQAIVKTVLEVPLRWRALFEAAVDAADKGETERGITNDMINAKYKDIKKRRRTR